MKSSDLALSVFIILIFILLYVFNILSVGIKAIEDDWPTYRCNPVIMPFASVFGQNVMDNFTFCIQSMQTNYMGYLMQPLNYNLDVIGGLGAGLTTAVNDVRAFFNNIRDMTTSIVTDIFGLFLNILIEFQRLTIAIKDMFAKFIGVLATLMYTLSGSVMTMNSMWAGPPGQLVKELCFHPKTKVQLKDGSIVAMKDVPLNAILKNGAKVCSVMSISNVDEEGMYVERIFEMANGEEGETILVSGSHLVLDPKTQTFVKVKDIKGDGAPIATELECDTLACLITSNHTIPIGTWTFHDWEDDNGKSIATLV
tara:strand:+ start:621 stop:1553 length:933 start_codon:yes stop_codon:yes gene_type:complete